MHDLLMDVWRNLGRVWFAMGVHAVLTVWLAALVCRLSRRLRRLEREAHAHTHAEHTTHAGGDHDR